MELNDDFFIPTNEFQTPITKELLDSLPDEVAEQLLDYIENVPFIKNLISPDRKRAKDLPRDEEGKIIVDLSNPHILEDMDYFIPSARFFKENGCYTFLMPNKNPNSEFYRWFTEEKRRCREGYIRESDGEWVPGYLYFFLNYCPMMVLIIDEESESEDAARADKVRDFPFIFEGLYWRAHYLYQARQKGKHGIELAKRGAGKAHPYDTAVYTPEGIKFWKDIKIGDYLYGDDGNTTKVVDIPFDGKCPMYRLTLADGRTIEASEGHLWKVLQHNKGEQILSTKEILTSYKGKRKISYRNPAGVEYTISILNNKGIEMQERGTKVDPYTFGLLLGDGCFRIPNDKTKCYYTCDDKDFEHIKNFIPYTYFKYTNTKYGYNLHIPNFGSILEEYGFYMKKSEEKFIPKEYLYNSKKVRLELLRGLLDSDGTVDKKGLIGIELTSKQLIEDIKWLCLSLGYSYRISEKRGSYKKNGEVIQCKKVYRLRIYTVDDVFKLPRKLNRIHNRTYSNYSFSKLIGTKIVNVEYIGEKLGKCVTVDNPSHCYLIDEFITTHNSFYLAGMLAHNLLLGESSKMKRDLMSFIAAYSKEYLSENDGTLSKLEPMLTFLAEHTEFPRLKIGTLKQMFWQMKYENKNGDIKGSLNAVIGVSIKDEVDKLRGKRGMFYFEEFGNFPGLLSIYNIVRKGLEDGKYAFGQAYFIGTANNKESNFASAKTLLYEPDVHRIYSIPNVFDKKSQGNDRFAFFFPSYINRAGCYNKNGVSDVVKALIEILKDRYAKKYSNDPNTLLTAIAEDPITPAEAIIKVKDAFFPVASLNERLRELNNNPRILDEIYIGRLVQDSNGKVKFEPTGDIPIRQYGVDNTTRGALEIYEMPQKSSDGTIHPLRYVIGHDPVDNDQAVSNSLSSTFVFDVFTDRIVAEYTGRQEFATDNYEIVRLLCLFYNAKCLFESNKKGIFSYFQQLQCTHLLALTPEYLRERQLVKYSAFGSNAYGVNANNPINNLANGLIRDWLNKTQTVLTEVDGQSVVREVPNLYSIKSKALLEELVEFDPYRNFDRVRALGMVMLYREERLVLTGGNPLAAANQKAGKDYLGNDDFFTRNYNKSSY